MALQAAPTAWAGALSAADTVRAIMQAAPLSLSLVVALGLLACPAQAAAVAPLQPPAVQELGQMESKGIYDDGYGIGIVARAMPTPAPVAGGAALAKRQAQVNPEATGTETTDVLPISATDVNGQPSPTFVGQPHDPLLALIPDFAFSMPAQVVVEGLNLAMLCVLIFHLAFTGRYHFPLSRKNYILQTSSTLLLLLSVVVELRVILHELDRKSHRYPYMFPYIGVQVPPPDNSWTDVQMVFYLLMKAVTTATAHITHIQFLTLLFPSALEKKLIFWMLGPLAIGSAGMYFTALSADEDYKTSDLGDAIRNICNSTLTLLYMSALFIWGFLVNRRRAWRTDGGTALFGGGAVALALLNTIISFIEIKFDRLWWLPDIGWTLTIWQSWLGFWWWVGSGMGIGEVEDRAERQAKRQKRIERKKRKEAKEKAARERAEMAAAEKSDSDTRINGGIRRLREAISLCGDTDSGSNNLTRMLRRRRGGGGTNTDDGSGGNIELTDVSTRADTGDSDQLGVNGHDAGARGAELEGVSIDPNDMPMSGASGDSNTSAPSAPPGPIGKVWNVIAEHQPAFLRRRFRRLRIAHAAAARRAATEQTALRDQVLQKNLANRQQNPGLGTMMNGHDSGVFGENERLPASPSQAAMADPLRPHSVRSAGLKSPGGASSRSDPSLNMLKPAGSSRPTSERSISRSPGAEVQPAAAAADARRTSWEEAEDDEWEDQPGIQPAAANEPAADNVSEAGADAGEDVEGENSRSWFWRGGLTRARLRDRTEYD